MSKLFSWILGASKVPEVISVASSSNKEESDEECDQTIPPLIKDDEEEVNGTVSGTGVISLLSDSHMKGVIDGKIVFDKSKFPHLKLKKGMKVNYTAMASKSSVYLTVTELEPIVSEKRQEIKERSQYSSNHYKVIKVNDAQVVLSRGQGDSPITLDNEWLPKDYPVCQGDWLELKMKAIEDDHGQVSRGIILAVNWTEQTTVMGKVTKYKDRLCINRIISFTPDVVENQQVLKENDRVRVIAVASDQEEKSDGGFTFKKRACAVNLPPKFMTHPSQYNINQSSELAEEEPTDELDEKFRELVRNKNGIRINPSKVIAFRPLKVGSSFVKTIGVENTQPTRVLLHRIYFANCQDVCKFKLTFERTEGSVVTTLFPNLPFVFKLTCTPQQLGRTKELCIFDFGDFKIGRWITVVALSDDEEAIKLMKKRNSPFQWNKKELPPDDDDDEPSTGIRQKVKVIRGAPNLRMPFFLPHRIPSNFVPNKIYKIYEKSSDEDLMKAFPKMKPEDWTMLTPENYLTRFQVSLWFEEIENKNRRRQDDMKNVILRQAGKELLVFEVPDLKEFHPAVFEGDTVKIQPSKNSEFIYEGIVRKIGTSDSTEVPELYVKFNEKFHKIYDGSPVHLIQFGLGRTMFKRKHFAINHAMEYLGTDWLFPVEPIVLKPPRIQFVEDPTDNVMSPIIQTTSIQQRPLQSVPAKSPGRIDRRATSLRGPFEADIQEPNSPDLVTLRWFNSTLNEEQKNCVRRILTGACRPLPYIIFGPPGTGKTVTCVEAILQIYTLEKSSRILVTVPSNAGADVMAEYLVATKRFKPGDFVRLNGFMRSEVAVPESIVDFCVDGEFLDSVAKHRLIICTVSTAGQFFQLNLNTGHFSHVFIDEAGYCMEPESIIPAVLAAVAKEGQIILAGDPKQLGPVVLCDLFVNDILGVSLLERLMKTGVYSRNEALFPDTKYNPAVLTKLVRSYRSHQMLLKLPSAMFYEDELIPCASHSDAYELSERLNFLPRTGVPLLFHGCDGRCQQDPDSPSWFNLAEVSQIVKYVKLLKNNGLSNDDIGIITPYRKQVDKVRIALAYNLMDDELPKVASVGEFQGGERKIIIISTVRSDPADLVSKKLSRMDFLYSKKRFNVAVTRAKSLMIIVGNPHVLAFNSCWAKLIRYAVELGVYVGCELPRPLDPKWDTLLVDESEEVDNYPVSAAAVEDDYSYERTISSSVDFFG